MKTIRLFLPAIILMMLMPAAAGAAGAGKHAIAVLPLRVNAADGTLASRASAALNAAAVARGVLVLDHRPEGTKPQYPADVTVSASLTDVAGRLSLDAVFRDLRPGGGRTTFYEEGESAADLPDLMDSLLDHAANFHDRARRIAEVRVSGNHKVDTGAILGRIETAKGKTPDPAMLGRDIKKIFAMGYFRDVSVSTEDSPEGRIVTFRVREKPVVNKVEIKGADKVKESDLREVIRIRPAMILNENTLRESREAVLKLYRDKGYHDCRLEIRTKKAKNGRVDVTFDIREGKRLFVEEIHIDGNRTFSDRKIRKVMLTKEKGWFSWLTDSGLLKEGMLEHDAARITAFYHNHGFLDVRVKGPELKKEKDGFHLYIGIDEGIRYRPGDIVVSGDIVGRKKDILALIECGREDYFSRRTMREDMMRITDYYSEHGYAFAEVSPILSRDRDRKTVNLTFSIRKGGLVRVNRIEITGNTRTRDKVIRREIKLTEGGVFNSKALRKSRERLMRLDFFKKVEITPRPAAGSDDLLDIDVEVEDKPTGTFTIGAGYSSVDKLSFMGEIKESNLMGRGQQLAAQVDISSVSSRYNLKFTEPHIFDSKLLFGVDLYNWSREYDDYTKDSSGAAIRFGYPVYRQWYLLWSYGYDDTSLSDVNTLTATRTILESLDYHITSAVKVGLSRDTRNRRYAATKGSHQRITLKYAGGPLGGDNGFTKVEATAGKIFPVSRNTGFYVRGTMGYVRENGGEHLPVYEKFYLGGMNTIRGFDSGEISPTETITVTDPYTGLTYEQKDRIGGTKMWYANFEYTFPLLKDAGLRGVIFYDIGNVYDRYESWRFRDVKNSAGFGFRWLSPVGPLRLEWGRNLNPKDGEDTSNWDFSIGGMF